MTRFMGLDFKTTKDTFIPRPETELLVKVCLECPGRSILDIGTGTGNIAISLARLKPDCSIVALDKSETALSVARENAETHGVSDRIEFINTNLVPFANKKTFDLIISNPPYIPAWEIETLAEHVRCEPRMAMDGGEDGLDFYRRIVNAAAGYLKDGGYLIMEMGYGQSYSVKELLAGSGRFTDIEIFKDFSNIDRVIKAKRWIDS